ncbi:Thioesterase superfamily, partial [Aspergillus sclerotialis]
MTKPVIQNYASFIRNETPPQEDINFFSALPFARPYFDSSSDYQPVPFLARHEKGNPSNEFIGRVINTHDTIPRMLVLMRKADLYPPPQPAGVAIKGTPQSSNNPGNIVFIQFSSGLNGYKDTVHGGVLSALFDEIFGVCAGYRVFVWGEKLALVTAKLEVSYRAPVPTPSVGMVKVWVSRREGRKYFLEAVLVGEDGVVRAEA